MHGVLGITKCAAHLALRDSHLLLCPLLSPSVANRHATAMAPSLRPQQWHSTACRCCARCTGYGLRHVRRQTRRGPVNSVHSILFRRPMPHKHGRGRRNACHPPWSVRCRYHRHRDRVQALAPAGRTRTSATGNEHLNAMGMGPIHRFLVGVPGTGRRRACPPLCHHSDRALGGHPARQHRCRSRLSSSQHASFSGVSSGELDDLDRNNPASTFSVVWVPFLFGTRIQTITPHTVKYDKCSTSISVDSLCYLFSQRGRDREYWSASFSPARNG